MILAWSGSPSDVPVGWALCDGNNGTPDLRGRFILGAAPSYAMGSLGGEASHILTINEMPSHVHSGTTSVDGIHTHDYTWAIPERPSHGDYGVSDCDHMRDGVHRDPRTNTTTGSGSHSHSFVTNVQGGSQAHNNMPPYYVLAYIMRIL